MVGLHQSLWTVVDPRSRPHSLYNADHKVRLIFMKSPCRVYAFFFLGGGMVRDPS